MSLFGGRRRDDEPEAVREPEVARAQGVPPTFSAPRPERTGARVQTAASAKGDGMANIGKSIAIKGDLTGNEDLVIEGKVEGKVELPQNQVTVGANGIVKAEVSAKAVVVIGRVAGNVRGSERVEIQATGVVEGDVAAPRLVVAEGAVVNGSIQMTKQGAAGAAPAPALAAAGGAKL
jgi:cytoskeletal protein CcmA (bactofilin family)